MPGRECQPRFEVRLHGAKPERFLGAAALVALWGWYGMFDCGIHGIPHWADSMFRVAKAPVSAGMADAECPIGDLCNRIVENDRSVVNALIIAPVLTVLE